MTNPSLEQALEFAQYQTTFNQQRQLLKDEFDNNCILAYNGGFFHITQEWLGGFDSTANWILDSNSTPVFLSEPGELFELAKKTYREALIKYGIAYQELKTKRTVRSLVES